MNSRVLILHNYYLQNGGEDSVVQNEYDTLKKNGFEVFLLKFNNKNYSKLNLFKFIFALDSIFSFISFVKVFIILKLKNIDILHVHNFYYSATPSVFWAAKLAGVKSIHTIHNYRLFCLNAMFFRDNKICFECKNVQSFTPGIKYKCFKNSFFASVILSITIKLNKLIPTFNKMVDKYIVVNLFTKNLLIQNDIPKEKIIFKANYLPDTYINKIEKKDNKDYYFFAGRLSHEKGVRHLIETFNKINKPLIIAGDGDLRDYVLNNSLSNIKYVGLKNKESIIELITDAKALIFPSIWIESMPMTIIESLYCGTIPIIATSINTKLMIDDRVNGILYDSNDPAGLENALVYFDSLNSNEKKQMSIEAINKFYGMYSENVHFDKIKEIYFC
jgi:glycosyltransferase involved in cell wall biosynthesis